ncbi:aminotransferase class I/II-fold pyridoxal phosphate-dependent enzyme [Solirubrobacter sp. CPCC 204708]|uniref:Aminotransferase class I/II-fold pyridoxal phosphate-dependent enzyme n=1 Tax=Solirubrobacter deserti TaxID=2282478 RepID=A0ABT4RUQ5_9ACTN|nr:aminotransferase class I/II-fold pyridoxal phosphate-dependent enzyme [Solirubrobacter deserti]MBE2319334.1 aminotransferase class I/II-fold pyridoxal phosphate-dependent enzyme [Solirubrobacter deserti]MDA0142304.1 aminotransferase class I/II-fold pyridoxal phosphate-dependent enzyme [Solirubrobacter deserti]
MTRISGHTAEEIAGSVRDLVSVGTLVAGATLPPIRALAADLGVNRNTVAAAYRQLVAAGVAETHGRGGTAIADVPELEREGAAGPRGLGAPVDLASGNPDPALLPDLRAWRAVYEPVLYGVTAEDPGLVRWARERFEAELERAFDVVVTHGAVDAVERVLAVHLTRGDAVAVEDPCFLAHIGTLRLNGFTAVPVAVDAEGMRPAALDAALRAGARAVVVTPRAHNPTGAAVTGARAEQLRAVLAAHPHVLVIEDDHFSALSSCPYVRSTPPETARWALVRSVTKFLGPDLRVAVVATDERTAARMHARLAPAWVSHLLQSLARDLLADPATTALVARARGAYAERAALLAVRLAPRRFRAGAAVPSGLNGSSPPDGPSPPPHDAARPRVSIPPDGLNVWVDVPGDADLVAQRLAALGFLVRPSSAFAVGGPPRQAVRVTTSTLTPGQAEAFVAALHSATK